MSDDPNADDILLPAEGDEADEPAVVPRTRFDRPFFPAWIIAHLLAWTLGWQAFQVGIAAATVGRGLGGIPLIAAGLGGAAAGALIGLAGWVGLNRHLLRTGWWIPACLVSWGLAAGLGLGTTIARGVNFADIPIWYVAAVGGAAGLLSGVIQSYLVMQNQVERDWPWILALGAALAIAWPVGLQMMAMQGIAALLSGLVAGVLATGITGYVMRSLV